MAVDIRYPPKLLSQEAIQVFYCLLRRDPASRMPAKQLLATNSWVKQGVEAFRAKERANGAHRGASMVDTTLSRQKEVGFAEMEAVRTEASRNFHSAVAPLIAQPTWRPAVLSAALPSQAMQVGTSVLLKPRPLQSLPSRNQVGAPTLCFVGTAR
eukprot:symbB.v1.2.032164.t1/scaffold3822.1/size49698/4